MSALPPKADIHRHPERETLSAQLTRYRLTLTQFSICALAPIHTSIHTSTDFRVRLWASRERQAINTPLPKSRTLLRAPQPIAVPSLQLYKS